MSDPIQDAIDGSRTDGTALYPPDYRMDPEDYAKFKKLMVENHGKWKGGNLQRFEFPFDASSLLRQLQRGERPSFKRDWHYFPTPEPVMERMCNILIPGDTLRILEPSAGQGAIVEYVNGFIATERPHEWTVIEPNPENQKALAKKGIAFRGESFEDYEPEPHDAIYANPPFRHDRSHVKKMVECLVTGGCMVVVLPSSFESKNRDLMDELERRFESAEVYPVDAGAFKSSGTGVSTIILAALYLRPDVTPQAATRKRTRL